MRTSNTDFLSWLMQPSLLIVECGRNQHRGAPGFHLDASLGLSRDEQRLAVQEAKDRGDNVVWLHYDNVVGLAEHKQYVKKGKV